MGNLFSNSKDKSSNSKDKSIIKYYTRLHLHINDQDYYEPLSKTQGYAQAEKKFEKYDELLRYPGNISVEMSDTQEFTYFIGQKLSYTYPDGVSEFCISPNQVLSYNNIIENFKTVVDMENYPFFSEGASSTKYYMRLHLHINNRNYNRNYYEYIVKHQDVIQAIMKFGACDELLQYAGDISIEISNRQEFSTFVKHKLTRVYPDGTPGLYIPPDKILLHIKAINETIEQASDTYN